LFNAGGWIDQMACTNNGKISYTVRPRLVIADFSSHGVITKSVTNGIYFQKVADNELWLLQANGVLAVNTDTMQIRNIMHFEQELDATKFLLSSYKYIFSVSPDKKSLAFGNDTLLILGNVSEQKNKTIRLKSNFCYNSVSSAYLSTDALYIGFFNGWIGTSRLRPTF
jgi:hypothetical protein